MSDPDIDLLVRLRRRIPKLRELANRHPEEADELDLLAYDIEYLWRTARKTIERVAMLESTPGTPVAPMASHAPIVRMPVLSDTAATREVFESPKYEDSRRASSVVSAIIEAPILEPMEKTDHMDSLTTYTEIRKRGKGRV